MNLFVDVNGQRVRKSSFSAMNDCVYPTSPDSAAPGIWDSKAEQTLKVSSRARNRLIAALASGTLTLGILGILGGGMTHDGADANAGGGMTHNGTESRADVPVGSGTINWSVDGRCIEARSGC